VDDAAPREARVIEGEVSETAEQLSAEEVLAAFEALSADDKVKLIAIERKFLGGTGRQQGELYREALCRALLGERHCPRTVPVMAFLVETMRSIASHDRKQQRRVTLLDAKDEIGEDTSTVSPGLLVSGELDPEEHLLAQEEAEAGDMVTTIQGHFQGDEECQLVLMGWADGLRGKELRDFVGVDQTRLDYLGKKIRRTMGKLYPNGWRR
jgi:DNA-directed RNA polymerase specialized sigma24 family protein